MKAVVFTLGCKVNDVESGSLIRGLEEMGYAVSRELESAELYVINTCAVTAEAEHKSRQAISKALKFNPTAKVLVCLRKKSACLCRTEKRDFRDGSEKQGKNPRDSGFGIFGGMAGRTRRGRRYGI